jgi:hypothetical protein
MSSFPSVQPTLRFGHLYALSPDAVREADDAFDQRALEGYMATMREQLARTGSGDRTFDPDMIRKHGRMDARYSLRDGWELLVTNAGHRDTVDLSEAVKVKKMFKYMREKLAANAPMAKGGRQINAAINQVPLTDEEMLGVVERFRHERKRRLYTVM